MENKTSTINIYIHSIWERMQRLIYKRESKEKSWELVKLEFKIHSNLSHFGNLYCVYITLIIQ